MSTAPQPLDSIATKIMWDRLVSIVDEATVVQYRTAFSTVVQEANDYACSIMDRHGYTLASAQIGLPSFVSTQSITLREVLRLFPESEIEPGDVFITNDPWIGTGQAMDLTVLSPVHKDGRLVAFGGSVAHSPDLGGAQRWNLSTDVFAEALLIPPMKLYERGVRNETLYALIAANSRMPELTLGDLEAQLAAIGPTSARLLQLMSEYGLTELDSLAAEIYSRSEQAMRDAISQIPDGTYNAEVRTDGFAMADQDGPPEDVTIRVSVEIEGSQLKVDFTGSSPQQAGSFNSVGTFTTAYTLYALRYLLVPLFPNNAGFYRPIEVIAPEGTVTNARRPAPTLSRHVIGHQLINALYTALAPAIPDRVFGHSGSAPSWDLLLMGEDARGRPFHRLIIPNGGTGAGPRTDGMCAAFPANLRNTPVEVMETLMPLVCEAKEIIEGSAGRGRHRGGFGQRLALRATAPISFSLLNAQTRYPAAGVLGGEPGRVGRASVGDRVVPPCSDGNLRVGETLVIETPGGGGNGPVEQRDPELTEADRRAGLWGTSPEESSNRAVSA
jgi:N-methylhydantoinase B